MTSTPFAAWRPDGDACRTLATLWQRLQAARPDNGPRLQPRRSDQWHITLCFIAGQPPPAQSDRLLDMLSRAAARMPPLTWQLDHIEYWPRAGAVVALPAPCPALQALCDASFAATRRSGIGNAQATTRPHLTLAYMERNLPAQDWLDAVDCTADTFRVEQLELLINAGGRYDSLGMWPLTGSSLPRAPLQVPLFQ